jgi:2-polyprenyl-6-methoxyphenol hydroxylase-like FAD-dependent oxidoreductase
LPTSGRVRQIAALAVRDLREGSAAASANLASGGTLRIECIGGGPAGLYSALLIELREPRHEVTVFERSLPDAARGWGVVLWRALIEKLYSADPESAHEVEMASYHWDSHVVDVRGELVGHDADRGYGIKRQRLIEILSNIVLTRDAAHTTHFTIGSGTKLAIEDAIALAENLHRHGELKSALAAYETERRVATLPNQITARLSAQFFENIPRYIALKPRPFVILLRRRRSPVLPYLPPRLSYLLYLTSRDVPFLRSLGRWVARWGIRIYNRLNAARARPASADAHAGWSADGRGT